MMKQLWSPWRMPYIEREKENAGCIFCHAVAQNNDIENLIICRGEHVFVILNRYPYTNGHMMIVPYTHAAALDTLALQVQHELIQFTSNAVTVLRNVYNAQAFNTGMNIGAAAGAGVAAHLHMHVLPRWSGDTNFMTTTAATRVMPEDLVRTYERISSAWDSFPS